MLDIFLRKEHIRESIQHHMDANPDVKYYLDDDSVLELVNALADGIAAAMEANNQRLIDVIKRGRF